MEQPSGDAMEILDKLSPEFITTNQQQLIEKLQLKGDLYSFGFLVDHCDLCKFTIIKDLTYEELGKIFFALIDKSNEKWMDNHVELLDLASRENGLNFSKKYIGLNTVHKSSEKFQTLLTRLRNSFQQGNLFRNIHAYQTSEIAAVVWRNRLYIPGACYKIGIFVLKTQQDIDNSINLMLLHKSEWSTKLYPYITISNDKNILLQQLSFAGEIALSYEESTQLYNESKEQEKISNETEYNQRREAIRKHDSQPEYDFNVL